ncbi:MAG: transcription antitermination factor NusB [Christensenellales bacterium]|jgi:N utilization substance protein B
MLRSEARAAAMKLVYEWEMGGDGGEETWLDLLEVAPDEEEADFAHRVADGTIQNCGAIDETIAKYAKGWTVARMHKVDLCVLRVAIYEMLYEKTPPEVVLNEAVLLAKEYCGDKAYSFVNGILGSFARAELA